MRECREIEKAVELYQGRPRQPTSPVPRSQKDSNMAAPLTDRLVVRRSAMMWLLFMMLLLPLLCALGDGTGKGGRP